MDWLGDVVDDDDDAATSGCLDGKGEVSGFVSVCEGWSSGTFAFVASSFDAAAAVLFSEGTNSDSCFWMMIGVLMMDSREETEGAMTAAASGVCTAFLTPGADL